VVGLRPKCLIRKLVEQEKVRVGTLFGKVNFRSSFFVCRPKHKIYIANALALSLKSLCRANGIKIDCLFLLSFKSTESFSSGLIVRFKDFKRLKLSQENSTIGTTCLK